MANRVVFAGQQLDHHAIIREASGSFTGKIDKSFIEAILNVPRKCVLTLPPKAMAKMSELESGAVVAFTVGTEYDQETRNYKITRRDWKRCKVYMLEVGQ